MSRIPQSSNNEDLFPSSISSSLDQQEQLENNYKLAKLLRDCASIVEKNQSHPVIYQTLGMLHSYAGRQNLQPHPSPTNGVSNGADRSSSSTSENIPFKIGATATSNEQPSPTSATPSSTSSAGHSASSTVQAKVSSVADFIQSKTPINANIMGSGAKKAHSNKPSFQRPQNPANSNLLATGWIEQQRRSKMRIVWKEVLASLVEGRKSTKEETTLWIQRQIQNPSSGKAELEALHQIPMKWVEDVNYLDFYGDYRFSIKVYNFPDEFHFKCRDLESTQNWVKILRMAREATLFGKQMVFEEDSNPSSLRSSVTDEDRSINSNANNQGSNGSNLGGKLSIKELRAIAHGAGIETRGMERADLEKIASRYGGGSYTAQADPHQDAAAKKKVEERMAQLAADQKLAEQLEHENNRLAAEQHKLRSQEQAQKDEWINRELFEEKRRQQEMAEMEQKRLQMQREKIEVERKRKEDEEKRRIEEERRRHLLAEQEKKRQEELRRQAEQERLRQEQERKKAEELRKQQEQQQRWAQQQEQLRRQQEAKRQQWQQQQQQHYNQQQQQQQQAQNSSLNNKYAMSEESEAAAISSIKRNVLISWALVPPNLQHLRPIEQLLVNIHSVLPPAFGVPSHDYFSSFKPILQQDLLSGPGGGINDDKLRKSVRKLRVFLHPDRLPHELNAEQKFLCKMLWDITSDAWEAFVSKNEELDWINKT